MTKKELKHDYKKVCKAWMKSAGYNVYIKDIKDVTKHATNYAHGIHHKVIYTVLMHSGAAYDIIIETRADGVYSETSGHFELVNIINFIW